MPLAGAAGPPMRARRGELKSWSYIDGRQNLDGEMGGDHLI